MAIARHFEIRYLFHGEQKLFMQHDSDMTDADAWYYACLHAGIGVITSVSASGEEIVSLMQHAERSGLTDVIWEELT